MKIKLKENDIQKTIFGEVSSGKEWRVVYFYDYDGTLLYSYTKNDFLNLNDLPVLPDRTGDNLTCDGWNWRLDEIKQHLNAIGGVVNVGAIYHTTDNKTHILCEPTETYKTASIRLTPSLANDVVVDWGDGSTDIWTTASYATKTHTYTNVTDSSVFDITISCTSGTYSWSSYISGGSAGQSACYTEIKLSNNVTAIGSSCFQNLYSLKTISIPNSVERFTGSQAFYNATRIQHVNVPRSITAFPNQTFHQCYALQAVCIPPTIKSTGTNCFKDCRHFTSVTIPKTMTTIGTGTFSQCYGLKYVAFPDEVPYLANQCFQNCNSLQLINVPNGVTVLNNSCFYYCYALESIVIPSNVTTIGTSAFMGCEQLRKIYIKAETPPTLGYSAFPSGGVFNTSCVMYVPRGTLNTYQSATNWSAYATMMVEYDY